MTLGPTSRISRGVIPLVAFAAISAALDVYAGNRFQTVDPLTVTAISFTLAAAFFLTGEVLRTGAATALRPLRTQRYDVIAINVTTAASWLGLFYALKYLEPAVVNVVSLAVGPVFTVVFGPLLRRGSSVLTTEVVASVGIIGLIGVLTWGSITGRSGVGELSTQDAVLGVGLTLVCGLGTAANVIYSKRLSDAGLTPRSVLALRFFLLIALAWAGLATVDEPGLAVAFVPSVAIAAVGVALPLYLIQVGIRHTEPITVSLLFTLSPLFAFLFQLPDRRLSVSGLTLVGILGTTALVVAGVVARGRVDARRRRGRCAIVDAYGIGRFLPAALRRHGVAYLHVRSEHPDRHLLYRPEDFEVDLPHSGDVAATAARLREQGVTFVVAGAESGVQLADALSRELGTPGNGMRRPSCRRDKHEMELAIREAGLASAETFASPDVEEIVSWANDRGDWPVVLKPLASCGTDNVVFCHSPAEIRQWHGTILAATDRYSRRNTSVLVQRCLTGDEHFVNTVSRGGVHHIVEIWRCFKRSVGEGRSVYDFEYPLPPDDPTAREIGDYVLGVLDALEIHNGAGHSEVMMTKDGPVLIECGARPGGSHVPEIVSRCLGTDQIETLARAIARPDDVVRRRIPPYQIRTHVRYLNLISPRGGTMTAESLAPLRALESFHDMVLTIPEGTPFPRTVDLATSPGYVYLISDDPAQIAVDYERLRELEQETLYNGAV